VIQIFISFFFIFFICSKEIEKQTCNGNRNLNFDELLQNGVVAFYSHKLVFVVNRRRAVETLCT